MVSKESQRMKRAREQSLLFATLRKHIDDARKQNLWMHADGTVSPHSVRHWTGRSVEAIAKLMKDEPEHGKRFALGYLVLMVEMATKARAYPAWCAFTGMLPRLLQLAGPDVDSGTQATVKLLDRLANTRPADAALVDTEAGDFFASEMFLQSELWKSYIIHRSERVLAAARPLASRDDHTTAEYA